jgi:hypothetical protein
MDAPLADAELDAIRERAGKATPGPWFTVDSVWLPRRMGTYVIAGHHDPHVGKAVLDCVDIDEWVGPGPDYSQSDADMEFAAHARQDIPRLLAALEAVTRERDAMVALIKAAVKNADSIDHDISYQGHICALIHVVAWRPLEAIGRREGIRAPR